MTGRILSLRLALATLCSTAFAAPAKPCPPQISVERSRAATPDSAFVLIHASRGCMNGALTVTGTAEGLVAGARRSIPLEIAAAGGDSLYRVHRQWPSQGVWVLHLVVRVGQGSATALVGVDGAGRIAEIREQDRARRYVPVITDADVERMLRTLAS